jgi:hypothetical protein
MGAAEDKNDGDSPVVIRRLPPFADSAWIAASR